MGQCCLHRIAKRPSPSKAVHVIGQFLGCGIFPLGVLGQVLYSIGKSTSCGILILPGNVGQTLHAGHRRREVRETWVGHTTTEVAVVAIRIDHILNFICEAFDLVVIIHSILDAHNLSLTQILDIRRCLWHAVVKASHSLGRASHEITVARIAVGHTLEHTAMTAATGLCLKLT